MIGVFARCHALPADAPAGQSLAPHGQFILQDQFDELCVIESILGGLMRAIGLVVLERADWAEQGGALVGTLFQRYPELPAGASVSVRPSPFRMNYRSGWNRADRG